MVSTLTLCDTCQQPLTMTFSKQVCQLPQLLKAFLPASAPDDICMQKAAKHASLEPLQKPPPTTWIISLPMYLHDIPWQTRSFDRSKGKKLKGYEKTWLLHQYTSINSMNWQIAPPVAEPVLLQPSAFLFPLLHLVQFAAPAQPSQHSKRIAKRLCSAWDSHTLDPQPAIQQFCLWAAEPEARAE